MMLDIKVHEEVLILVPCRDGTFFVTKWNASEYGTLEYELQLGVGFASKSSAILFAATRGRRIFEVNRHISRIFVSFYDLAKDFQIKEL